MFSTRIAAFALFVFLGLPLPSCYRPERSPDQKSDEVSELGSGGTRIGSPLVTSLEVKARLLDAQVNRVQMCVESAGLYQQNNLIQALSPDGMALVNTAAFFDGEPLVTDPSRPQQSIEACGRSEFSSSWDDCDDKPRRGGFLRTITALQDFLLGEQAVSVQPELNDLQLRLQLSSSCEGWNASFAYTSDGSTKQSQLDWRLSAQVQSRLPVSSAARLNLELTPEFFGALDQNSSSEWESVIEQSGLLKAYFESSQ